MQSMTTHKVQREFADTSGVHTPREIKTPRTAHIYRYKVRTVNGRQQLFHSTKEISTALGVSRYYIESFVKGLG